MAVRYLNSSEAPAAVGPYSHATECSGFVYCSGQLGISPETGKLISEDVVEQSEQCLKNLQAVLKVAGMELRNVLKTTIFLKDMNDFEKVNVVYSSVFGECKPARSTVQVSALPKNAKVEIEAVACRY